MLYFSQYFQREVVFSQYFHRETLISRYWSLYFQFVCLLIVCLFVCFIFIFSWYYQHESLYFSRYSQREMVFSQYFQRETLISRYFQYLFFMVLFSLYFTISEVSIAQKMHLYCILKILIFPPFCSKVASLTKYIPLVNISTSLFKCCQSKYMVTYVDDDMWLWVVLTIFLSNHKQ